MSLHPMQIETARRSPRFDVSIPITVHVKTGKTEKTYEAQLLNISEGGAFVHGLFPITLGDEVTVEVDLGQMTEWQDPNVLLRSSVCWMRGSSASGFGIRFTGKENERRSIVARLIDILVFQSMAA